MVRIQSVFSLQRLRQRITNKTTQKAKKVRNISTKCLHVRVSAGPSCPTLFLQSLNDLTVKWYLVGQSLELIKKDPLAFFSACRLCADELLVLTLACWKVAENISPAAGDVHIDHFVLSGTSLAALVIFRVEKAKGEKQVWTQALKVASAGRGPHTYSECKRLLYAFYHRIWTHFPVMGDWCGFVSF